MVAVNKLKGIIAERGLTKRQLAEELGITEKTLYLKMKKGVFDSAEMSAMIRVLDIKNPSEIFFCRACIVIRYLPHNKGR